MLLYTLCLTSFSSRGECGCNFGVIRVRSGFVLQPGWWGLVLGLYSFWARLLFAHLCTVNVIQQEITMQTFCGGWGGVCRLLFHFPMLVCMLYIDVPVLISVMYSVFFLNQSSTTLIGCAKPFHVRVPTPGILSKLTKSFLQEGKGSKLIVAWNKKYYSEKRLPEVGVEWIFRQNSYLKLI